MISLNEKEITQIYRDDSLVEYIYKGDRSIYDCMIDYVLNDDGTCYVNRAGPTYVARQENIEYLYIPNKICKNSRIYEVRKVGTRGGDNNKFRTLKKALIGAPTDESGKMAIVDLGFEDRTSLEEVMITDSVISIGFGAFRGCDKIAKMTLPPCPSRFDLIFGNPIDMSTGEGVPQSLKTVTVHSNGKIFNGLPDRFFYKCSYIETINIDIKNLVSIGGNAFEGCSNLKNITIPDSVTSIGEDAFKGCDNLEYNGYDNGYYLGNSNNSYVALIKAKDTSIPFCIINKNTKLIYSNAFRDCSGLTSVRIGNSVTSIGEFAFGGCQGLTSIEIPDSVTSIGEGAFAYSGLTSVTIPDSVTSIGSGAFRYCYSLTNVTIPGSVTSIGEGVFDNCSRLTSVTIGNGVTSIGNSAFYDCGGLTNIEIPDSVTSIGNSAFYNCGGLTSVIIGNSVTLIGSQAFYNCQGLTSIKIPDSVTSIGLGAFSSCRGLTSVTIGNSVTSIGKNAFAFCERLTSIKIPDSVTSIGEQAFYNCKGLTSVTIPNSVTSIGKDAFKGCDNLEYNGYDNGYYLGNSNNSYVALIKAKYISIPSCIINENTKIICPDAFRSCRGLKSITIPNSVTSIGDYAFRDCSGLTSVTMLPSNPPTLGWMAIPSNVTTITVPVGCGNTYKTAAGWSDYADKIVEATA